MTKSYKKVSQTKQVLNFVIPSWLEFFVYILSAFIILGIVNFHRLWEVWGGGVTLDPNATDQSIAKAVASIEFIRTSPLLGDIFVSLFWAALGSIVYMAIWFTHNSLIEVKHQAVGQHISGDMRKHNYLGSLFAHYLFFLTLLILTKAALYGVFFVLLPAINTVFYTTMVDPQTLIIVNVLWGIGAVLLLALIFYGLRLLMQIYSRFWRLYIKAQ